MHPWLHPTRLGITLTLCLITTIATAQLTNLNPPGDRDFILDNANMLDTTTTEEIRAAADQLLTDTAIPIIIVTIDSMAAHGGANMRIETFATILFDQWKIGHPEINNTSWNRGILLLISKQDRKARIELGADWARDYDPLCQQIMDEQIIPHFKMDNFPAGILAGVNALDNMARGIPLPEPVRPAWFLPVIIISTILFIFTIISLIRRGASGWAWVFWGVVFSILGFIILTALRSSSSSGFGGGSFGGGFSGGGGATGSW